MLLSKDAAVDHVDIMIEAVDEQWAEAGRTALHRWTRGDPTTDGTLLSIGDRKPKNALRINGSRKISALDFDLTLTSASAASHFCPVAQPQGSWSR